MMATVTGSGMADVQARIAAIQSRIQTMVPASAPAAPVTSGTPASAAGNPSVKQPVSFPAALASAGARTAPAGTVGSADPLPTGTSGDWAQKLPAAGQKYAGAIEQAATEAGVDPALLAALVQNESNFNANARSHAGAIGLAQLMPGTAAGLGVDPTDPLENLQGGAKFLKSQLDRFGSPDLALAAYNAGPGRVAEAGGIPRISETQNYVKRVMKTWEQLR